jgi:uncharacterized membrane protein HdeD (DUF308 family)
MSSAISTRITVLPPEQLDGLRRSWFGFVLLGIAMVLLGSLAIGWACLTTITIAATWLFGALLVAGGIAEILHSFSVSRWTGTLMHVLIGILYGVAGFVILDRPGESAILLTRLISIFLIVGGIFRIIAALIHRFPAWGYVLLNGVVTLLLGAMIYAQWPASGLWFIGLYLGIEMILNGWSSIALGLGLKRLNTADA